MESGRLMEGGRLIGGRLIEVGLYICLHGLALLPPLNDLFSLGAGLIPLFVGSPVPGPALKADAGRALFENPAPPGLFLPT